MPTEDTPEAMLPFWPTYAPTPLLDLPRLAVQCGVARIFLKDESRRYLGSFKSLGGIYAGLRALTRSRGLPDIATLMARRTEAPLPTLLCASDGNHGLAVATAAQLAGARARVYLPASVSPSRVKRITDTGAEVVHVAGTYDDAVDAAAQAAQKGEGLLISDTSADANDPVVADVLAGYGLMAREITSQLASLSERPTHLFVQAGVGGLAAALAEGLHHVMTGAGRIVVVEPETVACVAVALMAGRPVRIPGELTTSAEMLSCGEASAPAVRILLHHHADAVAVSESSLAEAVDIFTACGGPATTPSGATGLAGLLTARPDSSTANRLGLGGTSCVLLVASEGRPT
jgi:diaminopropionate ammonia-lyase